MWHTPYKFVPKEYASLINGTYIGVVLVYQTASMVAKPIALITVGPRSDSNLVLETPIMGSGEGGQPVPKGLM